MWKLITGAVLGLLHSIAQHPGADASKVLELGTQVLAKEGEFHSLAVGATMEIGRTNFAADSTEGDLVLSYKRTA